MTFSSVRPCLGIVAVAIALAGCGSQGLSPSTPVQAAAGVESPDNVFCGMRQEGFAFKGPCSEKKHNEDGVWVDTLPLYHGYILQTTLIGYHLRPGGNPILFMDAVDKNGDIGTWNDSGRKIQYKNPGRALIFEKISNGAYENRLAKKPGFTLLDTEKQLPKGPCFVEALHTGNFQWTKSSKDFTPEKFQLVIPPEDVLAPPVHLHGDRYYAIVCENKG